MVCSCHNSSMHLSLSLQLVSAPNPAHRLFSLPGMFLGHHQFGLQPPQRDLSVDIVSEYSPIFLSITSPTDWWTTSLSQRDRDCYMHESVLLIKTFPDSLGQSSWLLLLCIASSLSVDMSISALKSAASWRQGQNAHFHLLYFVGFFSFFEAGFHVAQASLIKLVM